MEKRGKGKVDSITSQTVEYTQGMASPDITVIPTHEPIQDPVNTATGSMIVLSFKGLAVLVLAFILVGVGAFYLGRRSVRSKIGAKMTNTITAEQSVTPTNTSAQRKVVDRSMNQYDNSEMGIAFNYPKDWSIFDEKMHIKDVGEDYTDGYVTVGSSDKTVGFTILRNPYEYYSAGKIAYTETVDIDGNSATLEVRLDCGIEPGNDGSDCPSASVEKGNYQSGYVLVYNLVTKRPNGVNKWTIRGPSWKPGDKSLNFETALMLTKDLLSTIIFLD